MKKLLCLIIIVFLFCLPNIGAISFLKEKDKKAPDYLWESELILWGKNLEINQVPYNGEKIFIESNGDIENPDLLELYFHDEKCGSILRLWILPFLRITMPWFNYGKVILSNFNGYIKPGFRENSYIIKGECFGGCAFFKRV